MSEIRRYSTAAVIFLVILRLGIGWHLVYEGLWKIDTQRTPTPWTSEGYLKNSQGPLRPFFRSLTGDPDDLNWLNQDAVAARMDDWKTRFITHYGLDERQIRSLENIINGPERFAVKLAALPAEVDFDAMKLKDTIWYDAKSGQLIVSGEKHLTPTEKQTIETAIAGKEGPEYVAFQTALDSLFKRSITLSAKERVQAHLMGNPENAGTIDGRISELDLYRQMVDRYEQKLTKADVSFEFDHLSKVWSDTRSKATEVAGPVKAIEAEVRADAQQLLTVEQLQRGPMPEPWTALRIVDYMTIAGLTILGALLMLGLMTRFAALSAAFMVFGFYMAMPPWPGVPEAVGPEHSFIINKNMIEVLALLALACMPSGQWFGLDAIAGRIFRRKSRTA